LILQDLLRFPNADLSLVAEIDKHMVTNFSSLDLHLTTKGHVFGAVVLHLLGLNRIHTAIQNLKIVLLGSEVIFQFAYAFQIYAVRTCSAKKKSRGYIL
jgi:hypothetical protein